MAGTKRRPGALPTVQETLLKKRKAAMEARAAKTRAQATDRARVRKHRQRGSGFVRVERMVKLGKLKARDSARVNRLLKHPGPQPLPPTSLLTVSASQPAADATEQQQSERPILIVRCRGRNAGIDARVSRALRLFRLTRINTAVFARPTPACLSVLRLMEPFVAWGSPDMRSVRELIYKRGHTVANGRFVPITDNALVEDRLGERGLLCIEDLVHELATCGPAFVPAASFLCPMRLRAPIGGWTKAEARFREAGYGDGRCGGTALRRPLACSRDEYINSLLREAI